MKRTHLFWGIGVTLLFTTVARGDPSPVGTTNKVELDGKQVGKVTVTVTQDAAKPVRGHRLVTVHIVIVHNAAGACDYFGTIGFDGRGGTKVCHFAETFSTSGSVTKTKECAVPEDWTSDLKLNARVIGR